MATKLKVNKLWGTVILGVSGGYLLGLLTVFFYYLSQGGINCVGENLPGLFGYGLLISGAFDFVALICFVLGMED